MFALRIFECKRKCICILPFSVLIIKNHILLINDRVYPARIRILAKFSDPRVEIRQALHFDYGIIILQIRRQSAGDIQHVHLLGAAAPAPIQLNAGDIFKLDGVPGRSDGSRIDFFTLIVVRLIVQSIGIPIKVSRDLHRIILPLCQFCHHFIFPA